MTAPVDGKPCVCDVLDNLRHEHSDFDPFPCADCPCPGFRPPGTKAEPAENQARTATAPPERPRVTVPADALDFSRQRVTDAARHLDQILRHHRDITDPDEPLGVCGLADLLEQTWLEGLDPFDVLALATRRLIDATSRRRMTPGEAIEHMRRKVRR